MTDFELTETEKEAGVTMQDVDRFAVRAIIITGPEIVVDRDLSPALGLAVARRVGRSVYPGYQGEWGYAGHNDSDYPVYRKKLPKRLR